MFLAVSQTVEVPIEAFIRRAHQSSVELSLTDDTQYDHGSIVRQGYSGRHYPLWPLGVVTQRSSARVHGGGKRVFVDAGDGVARQMALAGLPVVDLRAVFITHHHSDHNADYGTLLLRAWASGLRRPVAAYGPPPLE